MIPDLDRATRELERVTRRSADSVNRRAADRPTTAFWSTVTRVRPGAASDNNALVYITWRGKELVVAAYNAGYTPVVGHRVKCDVIDDQISIAYRGIGQP